MPAVHPPLEICFRSLCLFMFASSAICFIIFFFIFLVLRGLMGVVREGNGKKELKREREKEGDKGIKWKRVTVLGIVFFI